MQTKSLLAMTLLLVGSQQLTACTIVDASDDTDTTSDEPDAAASDDSDDNSDEQTTDESSNASDAGSDTTDEDESDDANATTDEDESDDANATSDDEDAGASDSSDDTTTEDEGDGGEEGETSEGDGGSDTTDPEDDDDAGSSGGGVYKSGSIGLTQSVLAVEGTEFVNAAASAGFTISTFGSNPSQPVGELPCTTKTAGECTLMECESNTDAGAGLDDDPGSQSEALNAGAVKITGLSEELTLTADGSGAYTPKLGSSRWWTGGETIVASVPGGEGVPAFELELTAPEATLTAPELSAPVNASRSADFEVQWEDGAEGTLSVSIIDANPASTSRMITCSVPADSGGVTVDSSLLEDFSELATVSVAVASTTNKTVEDWSLIFTATTTVGSGMVNFED